MARAAVVAGRAQVPGSREGACAPSAPMRDGQPSENKKIKLLLAHEIRARAMARALLRGASAGLDPLPAGVRGSTAVRAQRGLNAGEGTVRAWG